VTEAIRTKVGRHAAIGAVLKVDLADAGVVVIDGTVTPSTVTNQDRNADCTLKVDLGDLEAIIARTLDPLEAYSLGKLEFSGDTSVAMRLTSVL